MEQGTIRRLPEPVASTNRLSDPALERARLSLERYVRIRAHIQRSERVIALAVEQMDRADTVLRRSATMLRDLRRAATACGHRPAR